MSMPRVLIPVALGTNRDHDLAEAFQLVGADPHVVPLTALRSGEIRMADYQILAIPGGFSYGDALGAGRLLGLDLQDWFADQLSEAMARDTPILGICNGFQALVRAGILPGAGVNAVLTHNESDRFECRWVTLLADPVTTSPDAGGSRVTNVWTADLTEPLRCPSAHGEGRFVAEDLAALEAAGQIVLRYGSADGRPADGAYPANPNGSAGDVAGVGDRSGLVLGLMPHPENHIYDRQDPLRGRPGAGVGNCLRLFQAGVNAVRS